MSNLSNTILTSFFEDSIKIIVSDNIITIEKLPLWVIEDKVMVKILDSAKKKVIEKVGKINLPFRIKMPQVTDGEYTLHIFYKSKTLLNYFIGLNTSKGFPFQVSNGRLYTVIAKPFEENRKIFVDLNEEFVNSHEGSNVPYNQFIPKNILDLAHKIVRNAFSNYEKALAIHDWVAENIYYDYDSLEDNSYTKQKHDAVSVLERKRTVCAGYSELAKTLLRAVGVHAVNMDCFALGFSTDGDWNKYSNMHDKANHVITFAYPEDRWIMIDTTWDSDNEYRHGNYQKKGGHGVSHQYFDCTLAFFSYTHRFIK